MAVPVSSVEASALRGAIHRDGRASRRDARHAVVRLVELVPFPRVRADRAVAVGFTRDISERGMCLLSERPEAAGALLRITLHSIAGQPERVAIARVTRSQRDACGRHRLGLELLPLEPGLAVSPARPRLLRAGSGSPPGEAAVA